MFDDPPVDPIAIMEARGIIGAGVEVSLYPKTRPRKVGKSHVREMPLS
jgi:hypothetical protein